MRPTLPLALLALATATGCHSSYWSTSIEGEGPYLPEVRSIESFDVIALEGGWQLDVRVGEATSIVIHADENLHEHIAADVEDGRLRLHFLESVSSSNPIRAEITTPHLQQIGIAGSARLDVEGVDSLEFRLSIAGSGGGSVRGRTETLEVDIAGSGSLQLYDLLARDVDIDIAGSGKVEVHAERTLDVDIAGSGRVRYHGNPELSVDQAGSGSVRRGE